MPVVPRESRAVGHSVYGHVINKFSRMGGLPHFLTHGDPLRARELRYEFSRYSFTRLEQINGRSNSLTD